MPRNSTRRPTRTIGEHVNFEQLKEKISSATGVELNRLKNLARMMYTLGNIDESQWKELEKIAGERYGS